MAKKNTLLYLDEKLVKKAKELNVNISKITENAIKSEIFPSLSAGEKAAIDFGDYLKRMKDAKECFFLPFEIEKLEIKNIGPINKFKTTFNDFNLIIGSNASGKTTIIRSIAYLFGIDESFDIEDLLNYNSGEGKIEVVPKKEPLSIELEGKTHGTEVTKKGRGCILLDGGFARLDKENREKFIKYLKNLGSQIIITSGIDLEGDEFKKMTLMGV